MKSIDFKERLFIRADVAQKMRFCTTKEEKMFVAYKILNTTRTGEKQEIYTGVLREYLSEQDISKIILETSYGKFDNISFWINKIIQDIMFYSFQSNGYEKLSSAKDIVKCAFCIFIEEYVAKFSKTISINLLDEILNNNSLDFLHPVAFYEKLNIKKIKEYNHVDKDIRYLDLLELSFYPDGLLEDAIAEREDDIKEYALLQKNNKKSDIIASQMSFKHLLEN